MHGKLPPDMHHAAYRLLALIFLVAIAIPAQAGGLEPIKPRSVDFNRIELRTPPDGTSRSMSELLPRGPVLVHFWATWCAPCRRELPALSRFSKSLGASGAGNRLLVVSLDRAAYDHVTFMLGSRFNVTNVTTFQDAEGWSSRLFGLRGLPTTVLLDAQHRVVAMHAGVLDWDDPEVRADLMAMLTSRHPVFGG